MSEQDAYDQAAALELQYDAHGFRAKEAVRRVDPPAAVETFQPIGLLDAWVREGGEWIGHVQCRDGRHVWISETDLRRAEPT